MLPHVMAFLHGSLSILHTAIVSFFFLLFFFNDTATTEIYTLSLHDALPIYRPRYRGPRHRGRQRPRHPQGQRDHVEEDRKSTRLNSSHSQISYAVFCLKKKKNTRTKICNTA